MRSRSQFPAKNTTLNHSKMVNKRQKISNSELKKGQIEFQLFLLVVIKLTFHTYRKCSPRFCCRNIIINLSALSSARFL